MRHRPAASPPNDRRRYPPQFAFDGASAVQLLAAAIKKASSTDRDKVRDALEGLMRPGLALTGGLVLGVAESMVAGYLKASYQTMVALPVMLALMIWQASRRPAERALLRALRVAARHRELARSPALGLAVRRPPRPAQ